MTSDDSYRCGARPAGTDILAGLVAIIILVASLLPPSTGSLASTASGALKHVLAYALLAGLAAVRRDGLPALGLATVGAIAFGGLIELIQPMVGRSRELADFAANGAGCLAGTIIALTWQRVFRTSP